MHLCVHTFLNLHKHALKQTNATHESRIMAHVHPQEAVGCLSPSGLKTRPGWQVCPQSKGVSSSVGNQLSCQIPSILKQGEWILPVCCH